MVAGQTLDRTAPRDLARTMMMAPEIGVAALVSATPQEIAIAIEVFEAMTVPLRKMPEAERIKWGDTARDCLRVIGGASWPQMGPEARTAWLDAMMTKLGGIPGRVLANAARKALEQPYAFENQVEPVIRAEAEAIMKRNADALWRLKRWQADVESAASAPVPQIEDHAPIEIDADQVLAIMGQAVGPALIEMGLKAGYITPEAVAEAKDRIGQHAQN